MTSFDLFSTLLFGRIIGPIIRIQTNSYSRLFRTALLLILTDIGLYASRQVWSSERIGSELCLPDTLVNKDLIRSIAAQNMAVCLNVCASDCLSV